MSTNPWVDLALSSKAGNEADKRMAEEETDDLILAGGEWDEEKHPRGDVVSSANPWVDLALSADIGNEADARMMEGDLELAGGKCGHMNKDGTFKGGFDGCVLHMTSECGGGHSEESAKKICGKIAAEKAAALSLAGNPNHDEKGRFTSAEGGDEGHSEAHQVAHPQASEHRDFSPEKEYQRKAAAADKASDEAGLMSAGAGTSPGAHADAATWHRKAAKAHEEAIKAAGKIPGGAPAALSDHRGMVNSHLEAAKGHDRTATRLRRGGR
jgi:hypothetical protein